MSAMAAWPGVGKWRAQGSLGQGRALWGLGSPRGQRALASLASTGQGRWLEVGIRGRPTCPSFLTGQADPAHQGPHGVRGEAVCQGATDPAANAAQEGQVWGPGEWPGELDTMRARPGVPGAWGWAWPASGSMVKSSPVGPPFSPGQSAAQDAATKLPPEPEVQLEGRPFRPHEHWSVPPAPLAVPLGNPFA